MIPQINQIVYLTYGFDINEVLFSDVITGIELVDSYPSITPYIVNVYKIKVKYHNFGKFNEYHYKLANNELLIRQEICKTNLPNHFYGFDLGRNIALTVNLKEALASIQDQRKIVKFVKRFINEKDTL